MNHKQTSIQDKVIEEAADQLAKEIDFEVLSSAMIESGWIKVVLKPMSWEDGLEIDGWVDKNIKDKFMTMGLVWVFKNPKEANWFKLRWL
jgi:hypothetical protein